MDNTKNNIKKLIATISIIIAFVATGTYAYVYLSTSANTATAQAGCFEVNYSGQAIDSASLISTTNYLEGASSQVTLSKNANCDIYTTANIYIHTNNTTTAPINEEPYAMRYKVLNSSNVVVSEGFITTTNTDSEIQIASVNLSTTPTTYNIYIWVDSDLSTGRYNATAYSGYIYAESSQSSGIKN